MRYIIFSRVSGMLQTTENQLWECRNYVKSVMKDGDELIEFNEGITSTRLKPANRPVLQAMLNFAKRGDTLVLFKMSRLARDSRELVCIYNDLLDKYVNITSICEPNLDKSMICVYAMVAEMERAAISNHTKSALARKKDSREKVGTTLYGFKEDQTKLQDKQKCRSYGKPYLLIPNEDEKRQINIMIDLYKKGYGFTAIETHLTRLGEKNREGLPIHSMTIHRILTRLKIHVPTPKDQPKIRFQKSISQCEAVHCMS